MFTVYWLCFRKKLFNLINDMPTVLDVVTGRKSLRESIVPLKDKKEKKEKEDNSSSKKKEGEGKKDENKGKEADSFKVLQLNAIQLWWNVKET